MKTNLIKKYTIVAIALLIFNSLPITTFAASVYLESSNKNISVGDTAIISVKINAEGATINTVEGNVEFKSKDNNIKVQEFSLANSAFGLWPRTPSLSVNGKIISFVGGVPGGFNIDGATIFKIIVEANKEGLVTISPKDFAVYENDGKGTKLPVSLSDLKINILPKREGVLVNDEWKNTLTSDITPPNDFIIVLGQDKNLYGGLKFAYFSALDNQSGIDHYDVSENGGEPVRAGSTYVLKDQTENVKITVTAYDKAGNKKISVYPYPETKEVTQGLSINAIIAIIASGIVIVYIIFRLIFRVLKKNK